MPIYLLFGMLVSNVIAQTIILPFDPAVRINGRFAKEAGGEEWEGAGGVFIEALRCFFCHKTAYADLHANANITANRWAFSATPSCPDTMAK